MKFEEGIDLSGKKFYFISGFPRSGNTLLSSLLNQNPKIDTTGHSLTPDIMFQLNQLKYSPPYKNFPDKRSLECVLQNLFTSYYQDWKGEIIVERGDWITPCNFQLLKKYFPEEYGDVKIVVLVRDILDIIKSYLNIARFEPNFYINTDYERLDPTTLYKPEVEEKCDMIMARGAYVDIILYSIKFLLEHEEWLKKNILFVDYERDLLKDPEATLRKVYRFYEITPYYSHRFTDLDQIELEDGTTYNDAMLGGDMHTIRTDKISLNKYEIELPENVIAKYSNLEIWKGLR